MVVLVLSATLNTDCVPTVLDGRLLVAALTSRPPVAGPVQESLVFSSIWLFGDGWRQSSLLATKGAPDRS